MTIAEMIYEQVKSLPEQLAREVLDFARFLREREDQQYWNDLKSAQIKPLHRIWDDDEDRVWDDA